MVEIGASVRNGFGDRDQVSKVRLGRVEEGVDVEEVEMKVERKKRKEKEEEERKRIRQPHHRVSR